MLKLLAAGRGAVACLGGSCYHQSVFNQKHWKPAALGESGSLMLVVGSLGIGVDRPFYEFGGPGWDTADFLKSPVRALGGGAAWVYKLPDAAAATARVTECQGCVVASNATLRRLRASQQAALFWTHMCGWRTRRVVSTTS